MSELTNEIVLRPRFRISLKGELEELEQVFDGVHADNFLVKRLDEHIFIKFKKAETNFWPPQLHLELSSYEKGISNIRGGIWPQPYFVDVFYVSSLWRGYAVCDFGHFCLLQLFTRQRCYPMVGGHVFFGCGLDCPLCFWSARKIQG